MRLIDADVMREDWLENGQNEYVYDTNAVLDSIDEQPTIEAEPVRHGEWVGGELGHCTCCGHEGCASDIWDGVHGDMFCPNCGAEMRGGTNE